LSPNLCEREKNGDILEALIRFLGRKEASTCPPNKEYELTINEFSKTAQWEVNSGTKGAIKRINVILLLLLLLLKYFPNKYYLYIMLTVSGIYKLKCEDPVFFM
jgi:hypothetical protein